MHVASYHLADVVTGVAVAPEPPDDVREGLPGIFDAVDILDLLKLEAAAARRERELPCEEAVQANVVAEERIRSERDVPDANELGDVLEVLHHRLDGMQRVPLGERRVRRGGDADDAAPLGASPEKGVRLHELRVPKRGSPGVGDEYRTAT